LDLGNFTRPPLAIRSLSLGPAEEVFLHELAWTSHVRSDVRGFTSIFSMGDAVDALFAWSHESSTHFGAVGVDLESVYPFPS
jgi:hypothetical protein